MTNLWPRIQGKYQKTVNSLFFRRTLVMTNQVPYVSFTFDDFPRSSLWNGGVILAEHGLRGTYYASFGLMGTVAPTGDIFEASDIGELIAQGHELGCHTFSHDHAFKTNYRVFERSLIKNREALQSLAPGAAFESSSYPIDGPNLRVKAMIGRYFKCCRGGGQTYNAGTMDLNLLKSFFLEKSRHNPDMIKRLIDENGKANGWLIFATHDVSENHSPYGCTPVFFRDIVKYAVSSGARIMPVKEVLEAIRGGDRGSSR